VLFRSLLRSLIGREHEFASQPDAMLRLSVLAVAVEEDVVRLAERLRLSGAERERLLVLDPHIADLSRLGEQEARRALYAAGGDRWRTRILAAAAAAPAAAQRWLELYRLPETWSVPTFPLRGSDALAAGIPAGPDVGRILREVEAWWVEQDFAADEAALRRRLAEIATRRQP